MPHGLEIYRISVIRTKLDSTAILFFKQLSDNKDQRGTAKTATKKQVEHCVADGGQRHYMKHNITSQNKISET